MERATFIGVDLAWKGEANPSGLAVLRGDRSGAELHALLEPLPSWDHVFRNIIYYAGPATVVAIDAPLIIANLTGQRPCETLVGQRYGARHASCHTSNLSLYPDATAVKLAHALEAEGFVHAPAPGSNVASRVLLEVFPHAALVALFDLETIIKYKKGSVAQKRAGLQELRDRIGQLARFDPPLRPNARLQSLLTQDISAVTGHALKDYEDSLDAVVSAYLAFYYWAWRQLRNEVFGDLGGGYILNPILLGSTATTPAAQPVAQH